VQRTVHVWHDPAGRIVAWGHVPPGTPVPLQAVPLPGPDHAVVTVLVPDDDLPTLHETHYVEPGSKRLARTGGAQPR
jgi:hypothetical protein